MERYDQNSFYFNTTENLWCQKAEEKKAYFFVDCLKKSQITYDRTINQFNTKVWVFKNINKDKIEKFKNYWKAKN